MTTPTDSTTSRPADEDMPRDPFTALRVSYGMLLGVDDLQTLSGNPRGKSMLHNGWLHGSGIVWGYGVDVDANHELSVRPGLALDGIGRELFLGEACCLNLDDWVDQQRKTDAWDEVVGNAAHHELCVCVVATAYPCLTRPMPALADPCDPTRTLTDESRIEEKVHVDLRLDRRPPDRSASTFHRVRVLFGLDSVGDDDPPGERAFECADDATHGARCVEDLRASFHDLAARDVIDLTSLPEPGEEPVGPFPTTEHEAGVVLAEVCMSLHKSNGGYEVRDPAVDYGPRQSLLPTRLLQDLVAGLGARLLCGEVEDAGGPRVIADSLCWTEPGCLELEVAGSLFGRSIARGSIRVTALSGDGWREEAIESVRYSRDTGIVRIKLERARSSPLVRVVVRGTGSEPIVGNDFVPLAGVVGGPPTGVEGRDAVLTIARREAS